MKVICQKCNEFVDMTVTMLTDGPHYAKETCPNCNRFVRFVPKPDADKAKRPAAHRDLVRKFGRGFCEMCLRRENELPGPQTLHGHHVEEFADGGEPKRENVWILCTACHAYVNHVRTYIGHYRKEQATA